MNLKYSAFRGKILFEVDMKLGSHISLAPFQYEIHLKSEFLHVMLQACLRCCVTFQPRQSSDFPLSEGDFHISEFRFLITTRKGHCWPAEVTCKHLGLLDHHLF